MRLSSLALVTVLSCVAACTTPYDFRDGDRPTYDRAVTVGPTAEMQKTGVTVLDVRLREDFDADPVLIPDAQYRDPDDIVKWAGEMSPADGPVIVYCVRGKWVSQKAASYLEERGFEVYTLDGGIEAWKESGRPTTSE